MSLLLNYGRSASLSILLFFFLPLYVTGQNSSLVSLSGGSLSYTPFAVEGQSNAVNVIPDFSYAGYRKGGVALPEAPVKVTLSPSGGDDTPAIQGAIDMVEAMPLDANGFRGAVLLRAGRYNVDPLYIEASGVVLRGEGQSPAGTVLFAQLLTRHDVITLRSPGSSLNRVSSSKQEITSPYVPLGAYSFAVADASGYAVGDDIVVVRTPNQFWIDELGMDEATLCGSDTGCNGWTPGSYTISHERTITAITGNTITIDVPIVDVMEDQYGGGEIYRASVPGRIEQCGVELLRIESDFAAGNPEDEDHAWTAVKLSTVSNSWVKNVTGRYMAYGTVTISGRSSFNTVQECASIDPVGQIRGGRRYSFNISDGMGNLFQRNYTRYGRHDYVTGSRVTGPNVFLDNFSKDPFSDIGPHHRWATGSLYDNVRGGEIRVRNRGSGGSGHGWAGNANMFWNLLSVGGENTQVDSPKGGMNWGIGCRGDQQSGAGYWESWNSPVLPRSLYLQQLKDRLGQSAVNNITIPEQLNGDIYDLLESWAGECEFGTTAVSGGPPLSVAATADAYIRGGTNSGTSYGTDNQLAVKENGGTDNNDRMSFLKFDLSGITGPIYNVELRLYVSNDAPSPTAQNALHFVADDGWTESSLTWANQPAITNLIATKTVPGTGQELSYEITTLANNTINSDGILSLRLSEATVGNFYAFGSRERGNPTQRPYLAYSLTPLGGSNGGCSSIALPVTWRSFTASKRDKSTHLNWSTSNEINHDFFTVEWGTDGQQFTSIATVESSTEVRENTKWYDHIHEEPVVGLNYYRIHQVDLDGQYTFSEIKSVNFQPSVQEAFMLYPNPARKEVQLVLSASSTATQIQLFTITGQLLRTIPVGDQLLHRIPVEDLPRGVFLVRVGEQTKRLLKQ